MDMENNKIFRIAKRLANLSLVLGIMGIVGVAIFLLAFSTRENFLLFLIPVIAHTLIIIFVVIVPGIKVKKHADNLTKAKASLVLLLLVGIFVLITTIPGVSLVFANSSRSVLALPLVLIPIIISIWIISDSSKLLKAAKTQVSQPNI